MKAAGLARAALVALAALALGGMAVVLAQDRAIPLEQLRSGTDFLSEDLRALQQDEFANPGMLWVERGAKLWSTPAGKGGQSCASCHQDAAVSMRGVAASYPRLDAKTGELLNLEARISQCRGERQQATPFPHESEELLSITTYVSRQSDSSKINIVIDGDARKSFEAGRSLYYRRVGQMNLACAQCHEANWGKTLLAERISQGHPNAYPAYRLEWQGMGSLERRMRACLSGVRAEMLPYGAKEYRELALYLAWRAQGLPVEAPGVRR
jgi:sulfur-oxidizing protein SoxA